MHCTPGSTSALILLWCHVGLQISGLLLKAGDRVLLSGNFTTGFMIDLAKSYGTAASPVTITSLDPARRATITPSNASHAIGMYDGTGSAAAKGLGIRITDLNIVGTRSAGEPAGQ